MAYRIFGYFGTEKSVNTSLMILSSCVCVELFSAASSVPANTVTQPLDVVSFLTGEAAEFGNEMKTA